MKNLLSFLALVLFFSNCLAQQKALDKEKLLEFYQSQRYADAANYLASIYPNGDADEATLKQIAYCNMMAGKLADAEKNYLKINEIAPNQIPILFSLTQINAKRGNTLAAKKYLNQIIILDTQNFSAYKQLANYTDSVTQKIAFLEKANKLNKTDADVSYDLAFAYRTLKRYLDAYDVLKFAIAADTANLVLQQALLPVANQLNRYNEVVIVGEKLLQNNADADVLKDVAKAHFFLKNYEKAIKLYKMLEQADMQNEGTLYYTTLCYRELKQYTTAAKYAQRTIDESISPNIAAYYNTLAGIYEEKQQYTFAANTYKKGLTYTTSKNTYYRLGLLYDLKLKDFKSATTYYKRYLQQKDLTADDDAVVNYVKAKLNTTTPKN